MLNKIVIIFSILIIGTVSAEAQEYKMQVSDVSALEKYDIDANSLANEASERFGLDDYKYSIYSTVIIQSERSDSKNKLMLMYLDFDLKNTSYDDLLPLHYLCLLITDWSDNAVIYKEFFNLEIFPKEALIKVFPELKGGL